MLQDNVKSEWVFTEVLGMVLCSIKLVTVMVVGWVGWGMNRGDHVCGVSPNTLQHVSIQ